MMAVTGTVHALALVAALANPLHDGVKALLATAIIAHGILDWRRLNDSLCLIVRPDDEWEVISRHGSRYAQLAPSTVVTAWIVILHLSVGGRKTLAIPICRDGLEPDAFRRLRVYLRTAGQRAISMASSDNGQPGQREASEQPASSGD